MGLTTDGRLDRRLHAFREDLVDARLRGRFSFADGSRFVVGEAVRLCAARAYLRRAACASASIDTEVLFGANLLCFERGTDWSWVQAGLDGYVGYVETRCLGEAGGGGEEEEASRVVSIPLCPLYWEAQVKAEADCFLPMGSLLRVEEGGEKRGEERGEKRGEKGNFLSIRFEGRRAFVHERHVLDGRHLSVPRGEDFVSTALKFLEAPYLWGGNSAWGIDCSALLQVALGLHGIGCPRDTDMQREQLGERVLDWDSLWRGDFVFWRGHVGIMLDAVRLLHANAHHMRVAYEPFSRARVRIWDIEGEVLDVRRVSFVSSV